jgi:hypothetical protein
MSDIQRWTAFSHGISEYEYWHANAPDVVIVVTYADHLAAVAAAEQRAVVAWVEQTANETERRLIEQGQRDALAGAVQRVEALNIQGTRTLASILAAIKGDSE